MARVGDWLYPRVCVGCEALSDWPGRHLCASCRGQIRLHDRSLCEVCGAPVEGAVTHAFVCGACTAVKPAFDRARAAGQFRGVLRAAVHQFKYGGALWLARDLADLLEGCVAAHFDAAAADVVVPVPLYPLRQRERGYNQAAVLGGELACRLGRRFDGRALARVRETQTQTRLSAPQRRENILGAFAVERPAWVVRRRVLLVDDVMTTGATLNECARVLKRAGAREVWAVTVARG